MSVIITQQPQRNAYYAKNTVPELHLEANETVVVSMGFCPFSEREDPDWGERDIIFRGSYAPDFDGNIIVDFGDLYGHYLQTVMPANGQNLLSQDASIGYFHITLTGSVSGDIPISPNIVFFVVNAELQSSTDFESWSQQNFLTNQPVEKTTNYESPEWLTYLDLDCDWTLVARFYPIEGGNVDAVVRTDEEVGCYSANVRFSRLIPMVSRLPNELKGYYDLILLDGSFEEICRQRYIVEHRSGREKYYCMVNELGGIDTLICDGENTLQPEMTYNIGRFGKRYRQLNDTDDRRRWNQATGLMPFALRDWVFELLATKQGAVKYFTDAEAYQEIVVTDAEIGMGDGGQLASASFGYMLTEAQRALDDVARSGRYLSQSTADEADEMDDIRKAVVLAMSEAQEGSTGYVSEEMTIATNKLYIDWVLQGDPSGDYVYVNFEGKPAGRFLPGTDTMPFVITKPVNAPFQFTTDDAAVKTIVVRYYPTQNT